MRKAFSCFHCLQNKTAEESQSVLYQIIYRSATLSLYVSTQNIGYWTMGLDVSRLQH